jgi:uncharacterized protein
MIFERVIILTFYNDAMRPVIALFAKAPAPGQVKTRLASRLGAGAAARLHTAFVEDLLDRLLTLDAAGLELHTDIETDAWRDFAVTQKLQCGGDLGLRMLHALDAALRAGAARACIAGSDAPTLPLQYLETLLQSPADVALGPTEDGGYYAIACRRVHPEMFRGVAWSTGAVLEQTERAVRACGLSVERGPAWWDVDEFGDLLRLAQSPDVPPRTRAWLDANAGLLQ